jgi:hypothetical protein
MGRRVLQICIALLALAGLAVPAASLAKARKKSKRPAITRVTPMRLRVGGKLTIRGKNFSSRKRRNTVVFRGPGGRTAFAKPRRASRRKLVVIIPRAAGRALGGRKTARFKLRIVVKRKFSRWTSKRLSPVVISSSASDDGDGVAPSTCLAGDSDGDLLSGSLEQAIGTDSCLADTDGDGDSDGWEYYAARDLNIKAVPYPGKRPFPNALDPSDPNIDFDGDGLASREEYRAWRYTGSSFIASKVGGLDLESPLGYSDGTKYSRASETPAVPDWRGPDYGLAAPTPAFPATFNLHGDGPWRDDERDADRDGLSNWLESSRGPSNNNFWKEYWQHFEPPVAPWKDPEGLYCGYRPGHFNERPFATLDLADDDVDGDRLLDGEDDQDNDSVNNITELYEVVRDLDSDGNTFCSWASFPTVGGAPINAFNPCVPNPASRTCDDYIPF